MQRRFSAPALCFAALAVLAGTSRLHATLPAGPYTLEQCLELALAQQPSLAAARASLAAAQSGQQALSNLGPLARLTSPDLPIRRQQACHGITIAQAMLVQVEWETRYAVTRNFYTIQYIRLQQGVLGGALGKLEDARKRAQRFVDAGDPKFTKIDVDTIALNTDLLRTKEIELVQSLPRALSALREAIGVGPDCPLEVVETPLPALVTELNKEALIAAALHGRAEVIQAHTANQVTALEIDAQNRARGKQVKTFAAASDIHAKEVPQGVSNTEYRPGAIGIEMPTFLIGSRHDRMQRAGDFNARAGAVVDKTHNLVALEVENYYLKWDDAKQRVERLASVRTKAADLRERVWKRFNDGDAKAEDYLRSGTLADQVHAQYNEALYHHALALAALERATSGALQVPPPPAAEPDKQLP
jgi:outer membrane protein TolC